MFHLCQLGVLPLDEILFGTGTGNRSHRQIKHFGIESRKIRLLVSPTAA